MATTNIELDCALSLNEITKRHPATGAVFTRFGLDHCCGGSLSVTDAARAHGLDVNVLCAELNAAANSTSQAR